MPKVEEVLAMALERKPREATHWSTGVDGEGHGLEPDGSGTNLACIRLGPHRTQSFKLSTDPLFIDKVRDITGLYLSPPIRAGVLCIDEK